MPNGANTWAAAKPDLEVPEREIVQTVTDFTPPKGRVVSGGAGEHRPAAGRAGDLSADGIKVRLRAAGLQTLVEELRLKAAA